MSLQVYLSKISFFVEEWYANNIKIPKDSLASNLYSAMEYSFNAGGKRLRPALTILGYDFISPTELNIYHPALPFATAIEMVHTYSLIHDDLPGMDNDDIRRGKPTSHIVFGESTAILAGDALLTKAFEVFLNPGYHKSVTIQNLASAAFVVAKAIGPDAMIAGQYADMAVSDSDKPTQVEENFKKSDLPNNVLMLNYIHQNKTSEFIAASITSGALIAGGSGQIISELRNYGLKIGQAFQIYDDILDVVATSELLGKPSGSDQKNKKLTYPSLYGIEESENMAKLCIEEALDSVSSYNNNKDIFVDLANYIIKRKY